MESPEENKLEAEAPSKGEAIADKAKETYEWWNNLATINAEDPFLVGAVKILVRLVGILILLALSPFLIFSLLLAFFAAT